MEWGRCSKQQQQHHHMGWQHQMQVHSFCIWQGSSQTRCRQLKAQWMDETLLMTPEQLKKYFGDNDHRVRINYRTPDGYKYFTINYPISINIRTCCCRVGPYKTQAAKCFCRMATSVITLYFNGCQVAFLPATAEGDLGGSFFAACHLGLLSLFQCVNISH